MTSANSNKQSGFLVSIIILAALWRLIPHAFGFTHLFNLSPIGAMALFGGAYFSRSYSSFLIPFLALWLSNLVLDNVFFAHYYPGFVWFANWEVYFTFALIVVLGTLLLKKISVPRLLSASLGASLLFFLVTNFFVWLKSGMYPSTPEGLLACYVAAIPFFNNTLLGDLVFTSVLFGVYEWFKAREATPALK
jgi:hypothetical protein